MPLDQRLIAAGAAFASASGLFALVRFVEQARGPFVGDGWLFLIIGVTSGLVWLGFFLAARTLERGALHAVAVGSALYLAVGAGTLLTGIPGYIDPGYPLVAPFWPFFWLWLHACTFGIGLWPCPSG